MRTFRLKSVLFHACSVSVSNLPSKRDGLRKFNLSVCIPDPVPLENPIQCVYRSPYHWRTLFSVYTGASTTGEPYSVCIPEPVPLENPIQCVYRSPYHWRTLFSVYTGARTTGGHYSVCIPEPVPLENPMP
ncbi:hypothetical protein DPEC_G00353690, partial [Dallia pectoralis]